MTKNEMIKRASEGAVNDSVNEVVSNEVVEAKEITKVLDISRKFTEEFFAEAPKVEQDWMIERSEALVAEKGDRKYFAAFRSEFAKRYFPELFKAKSNAKKASMVSMFKQIQLEQASA
ncbi:MAG: hypothetical protein HN389_06065 [Clostridia bacterium]|jgi:hypothetical protein|nr:hypothetical protein [Clostridia bacterium]